jgi:hypothetical protein
MHARVTQAARVLARQRLPRGFWQLAGGRSAAERFSRRCTARRSACRGGCVRGGGKDASRSSGDVGEVDGYGIPRPSRERERGEI